MPRFVVISFLTLVLAMWVAYAQDESGEMTTEEDTFVEAGEEEAAPPSPAEDILTLEPSPTPVATAEPTQTSITVATPTPTPIPPPRLGSRENPIPRGTTADLVNGWSLVVVQVIENANSIVERENIFNDPPKTGSQYFMVRVTATYHREGSSNFRTGSLKAVGASQVSYSTFENSCGVIPERLSSRDVFTGGSISGNICWEVPKSEIDTLLMYYDATPQDRSTFFALR